MKQPRYKTLSPDEMAGAIEFLVKNSRNEGRIMSSFFANGHVKDEQLESIRGFRATHILWLLEEVDSERA